MRAFYFLEHQCIVTQEQPDGRVAQGEVWVWGPGALPSRGPLSQGLHLFTLQEAGFNGGSTTESGPIRLLALGD